jgi:hypothetical protein
LTFVKRTLTPALWFLFAGVEYLKQDIAFPRSTPSLHGVDASVEARQLLSNDFVKKVYLRRNQPLLVRLRRVYAATWRIFFQ